mgnify:CR=1 FL=1
MDTIQALNKLIEKHRTKITTLAKILGKNRQTIYNYLDRKTTMSAEDLMKLADYYNVEFTYFLGGTNQVEGDESMKAENRMLKEIIANKDELIKNKDDLIKEKDQMIDLLKERLAKYE